MEHEDFVTYEQALRLKELGFDWKVRACYRRKLILDDNPHYTEPKFVHNDTMRKRWTTNYNDNRCGGGSGKYYYSAPTLAQAQKWLREKEIEVGVFGDFEGELPTGKWVWLIRKFNTHLFDTVFTEDDIRFDTYEKALSAGIDKALELLGDD